MAPRNFDAKLNRRSVQPAFIEQTGEHNVEVGRKLTWAEVYLGLIPKVTKRALRIFADNTLALQVEIGSGSKPPFRYCRLLHSEFCVVRNSSFRAGVSPIGSNRSRPSEPPLQRQLHNEFAA